MAIDNVIYLFFFGISVDNVIKAYRKQKLIGGFCNAKCHQFYKKCELRPKQIGILIFKEKKKS